MKFSKSDPEFAKMITEFKKIIKKIIYKTATEDDLQTYDKIKQALILNLPEEDATLEIAKIEAIAEIMMNGRNEHLNERFNKEEESK